VVVFVVSIKYSTVACNFRKGKVAFDVTNNKYNQSFTTTVCRCFKGGKKRQIKSKSPLLGLKTKTFLDSSVHGRVANF
jgi:hypothetical protein